MRNRSVVVFLIFSVTILWFICPFVEGTPFMNGHLSYQGVNVKPSGTPPKLQQSQENQEPQYNYFIIRTNKPGHDLSMHVLEIDPTNPNIQVRPVTSQETLFGFSYLSDMNRKWNSLATINGGFSHPDGHLGGLYGVEGELLTTATGQYPGLFMVNGKAFIEDVKTSVWLECGYKSPEEIPDGEQKQKKSDVIKLENFYYNQFPKGDGLYVFTPIYGSENWINLSNLCAVISKGEVQEISLKDGSCKIPKDGFLISAIGDYAVNRLKEDVKPGMQLKINNKVLSESGRISEYDWAYECGSWILKDGQIVVPDFDTWVGNLNIRTPRTAVGIKEDGTLVFVAADGRQKGLSDGLTGKELAQKLLELGVRNAAFLDGGASTEMILEGKIVNSPSAGRERMLASCFVVLRR